MLIKQGDTVVVIAGAKRALDKRDGKTRQVLSVNRQTGKAIVEGLNLVLKHVKRSQKNPQGGRLKKEMPVDISNLQYYCSTCAKGVRLGARFLEDGSKERYCKKCGTSAGKIAPARALHQAKKK
jgi:large subunit ribosomal protein L24